MALPKLYEVEVICKIMVLAENKELAIDFVENEFSKEVPNTDLGDEVKTYGVFSAKQINSLDEIEDSWLDEKPYNACEEWDLELTCKECF